MIVSPLRRFIFAALLWLPFAFFLWFAFAAQWAWPVVHFCKFIFVHFWPKLFLDTALGADQIDAASGHLVAHRDFWMQISTNVVYNAAPPEQPAKLAFYDFTLNPMIYGYSLPLFAGLVMATPLERRQRVLQIVAGLAILWLVQCFGVIAEAFKSIGVDLHEGAQAMKQMGYSLNAIALCYQFGYLILPPLAPAVLWILFNRAFVEELTAAPVRP